VIFIINDSGLTVVMVERILHNISLYQNHRYYTNNTGLEVPFRAQALIVATEVINLKVV